jgi:nucleotide-binding universal stress UspA family protein
MRLLSGLTIQTLLALLSGGRWTKRGCQVRRYAVYVSDWPTGVRADGRPLVVEDLLFVQEGELEHTNRAAITEIFREIAPEDDWSLQFAKGKTGQILVGASRHSRLLVVGTGEHVGLGRIMLGSTSHYCLSHASCPVVAVPALDDSSAGGSAAV